MREVIKALQALQKIDQEIHALRKRRVERPARVREAEELWQRAKGRADAQKTRIRDLQKSADVKELDLKDREGKIAKLEVQLNTSKSQKDFDAIKHQMASFRTDNSVLEDEILKIMSEVDAAKSEIGALEAEAARRKAQFDEVSRVVSAEVAEVDRQIAVLEAARKEKTVGVPPETLDRYGRIVNSRDGVGLASVHDPRGDATCSGCNISLTLQQVSNVMNGKDLIQCKACSRILYIP